MGSAQRQSQKGKGTQTMPVGASVAAAGARRGNGKNQPYSACRLSMEERRLLVEQLAYARAEQRGFGPGEEWRDWFEAEAEVKRLLR